MKEFNYPPVEHSQAMLEPEPTTSKRYRQTPRWIATKSRTDKQADKDRNFCVEAAYHRVIATVKELILQYDSDTIYEQDHKHNPESYTGMHSFVTSTFYWRLDCELNYNYEVYFAFHNCPYEAPIRKLMEAYPLDRTTHQFKPQIGYVAFYSKVLEVQDPINITTLKG